MGTRRDNQEKGQRAFGVCVLVVLGSLAGLLAQPSPALAASAAHASPQPLRTETLRIRPVLRDPDAIVPLRQLLEAGVDRQAHGDLEAADAIWAQVRELYPGHPAGPFFEIKTLQDRRSLDWQNAEFNDQMYERATESLSLANAWLKRAPDSAQAHLWAGLSLFELVQLDGMAKRLLKAGKQGEKARKHLERALEIDPTLTDAKLPLGSYYYYASIATRFIRWLTWLWFVPTGEHDLGLAYVEEVARDGDLMKFDARTHLARFYLYLEEEPVRAAPIIEQLHAEYPDNSYLHFEVVELRMLLDDYDGTVQTALELERREGSQPGDAIRRVMARIWRARAELFRGNPKQAEEILEPVVASRDELNPWSRRWLLLTQGNLSDVTGDREQAVELYEQLVATKPFFSTNRTIELAQEGLEVPFQPPGPVLRAMPGSVGAAE